MECFSSCVSTLFWFYILATLLFLFNLTIFISIIFKCDKLVNKVEHVAAKRDRYLPQELVQTKWELKAIVMVVLKWGCKRYLSIVSVLPTVNGCLHVPGLEKQTAVDWNYSSYCSLQIHQCNFTSQNMWADGVPLSWTAVVCNQC